MPTTQSVLDHHLQCFAGADLEGTMLDYAPNATLMIPQGAIKGTDAIRDFFRMAYAEFSKPGAKFEMKQVLVDGECAFIFGDAESADNTFEAASDTFVIRDGKIVYQTYAAKVTPKR
jgi:ketosteroid isomerase-like protein